MCPIHKDFRTAAHSTSGLKYTSKWPELMFSRLIFLLGSQIFLNPIVHSVGHPDNGNVPYSNGSGMVSTPVDIVGYDNLVEQPLTSNRSHGIFPPKNILQC